MQKEYLKNNACEQVEQYIRSKNRVSEDDKANQLENASKELCVLKEKMANLKMSPCDSDDFRVSTPFGNTTIKQLISVEPYLRTMIHDVCTENDKLKSEKNDIDNKVEQLKEENESLKHRLQNMTDVCDGSCFSDEEDDRDKLIAKLQDQHQQDCIKINQLHVTIDTLVDKYSRLRKTVGMD